jgi:hypothetical protein
MKKKSAKRTARIGAEAALVSRKNRVFVDRKKAANRNACRKFKGE